MSARVKIVVFQWKAPPRSGVGEFLGHFDTGRAHADTFRARERRLFVKRVDAPVEITKRLETFYCGALYTRNDQRALIEMDFSEKSDSAVRTIEPSKDGAFADLNLFCVSVRTGRGIYATHKNSLGLMGFCDWAENLYRRYAMSLGEGHPAVAASRGKLPQLEAVPVVQSADLDRMMTDFARIKKLRVRVADAEQSFASGYHTAFSGYLSTATTEISFSKKSDPFELAKAVYNGIQDILCAGGVVGRVTGEDEEGRERSFSIDKNIESLFDVELDSDGLARFVRGDSSPGTVLESPIMQKLVELTCSHPALFGLMHP